MSLVEARLQSLTALQVAWFVRWSLWVVLAAAAGRVHAQIPAIDFDRDIRPILSDKCFACHGPDEQQRQADLRLDERAGLFGDLGGYRAVVPGRPEESELLRRVLAEEDDLRMPPPESKLAITADETAKLRAWIEQGAAWSGHWAYEPIADPPLPPGATDWMRNGIDAFIAAAARQNGLEPQSEAPREQLIRRVTLDLTGVPPTPEEIDAFQRDTSPAAYEKLVDRLLSSPRYGQRMAWDWLEAGRYADTDGFQGDPTRTMWPWRDWLVDALNRNMPFDEFTITMLAGDLFPEATPEDVLATGFNRNHMFNGEGGRIPEETRVENVFDRTETVATVWLGLTFTCCRCHDHKYDPFTQKEYYRLFAFFNNTSEDGRSGRGKTPPVLNYLSPELRAEKADLEYQLTAIQKQMHAPQVELDRMQAEWESRLATRLTSVEQSTAWGTWYRLGPLAAPADQVFDAQLGPESLGLDPIDVNRPIDGYAWTPVPGLKDGAVHPLPDAIGATYLLRDVQCPTDRTVHVSLGSDDGIKVWVNGQLAFSNNVTRGVEPDQDSAELHLRAGPNQILLKVVNTGGIAGVYFRPTEELPLGLSKEVVAALRKAPERRGDADRQALRVHFRKKHWAQWEVLERTAQRLEAQIAAIDKQAVAVMVMDDLPQPRPTYVLHRGDYQKPTDAVEPGTPSILPPLPSGPSSNRLDLARWLMAPDNPLTARVIVNRYWQSFFGRGLVTTPEDFGSQGERPTHPELLDWLATRFIQSGWDVKALHRMIVTSATYRQRSTVDRRSLEIDPENKWLARAPRYRWPSWMLRDQALAIGGVLSTQMGGPPVKPYQPAGLWAEATFGKIQYRPDSGEALYRRSLYVFWRRIIGPPMFFDSAKRQTCEVKPSRTNSPLHALTTMNETGFVESARAMAERVWREAEPTTPGRLRYAFRLATARWPTEAELRVLRRRYIDSLERFSAAPDMADALLRVGEAPRDPAFPVTEHAAWTVVCNLLLNLDETLSRE